MSVGYYLLAIPVFGLIIICHELGHFLVAKACGIRVEEFALGFGPRLAGFQAGETRYNVRLFVPLGGFVRMAGMEDGDTEDPRGFMSQSIWRRAAVIVAGPLMNFVLAFALFALLFAHVGDYRDPVVSNVRANYPAAAAGLRTGDHISSVNGVAVNSAVAATDGIRASAGKPITFGVLRGNQHLTIVVTPELDPESPDAPRYVVGVEWKRFPLNPLVALARGGLQTLGSTAQWFVGLAMMVTGRLKAELSGPVGITVLIAKTAQSGIEQLLYLAGFLSINIGILNLLPIPALDGSRLMFMLIEWIRGRRINPQRENMIHFVGLVVLMALTVLISYSELVKR